MAITKPSRIVSPEKLVEIEKLAGVGCTWSQIAAYIDIPEGTIKKKANCKAAYAKGIGKGIATIAALAFRNAASGDQRAIEFWLRTRAGWRDGVQVGLQHNEDERHQNADAAVRITQMMDRLVEVEAENVRTETPPPDELVVLDPNDPALKPPADAPTEPAS